MGNEGLYYIMFIYSHRAREVVKGNVVGINYMEEFVAL